MAEPSPLERHARHVEDLGRLLASMPPGVAQERVRARYEAVRADHEVFAAQQASRVSKSNT